MNARLRTVPRKKPRQARAGATYEAILEATAHILVESGYDHASTNKIAAAAGVSIGSLYQYFPSKEALVATLCERHASAMMAICREKLFETRGASLAVAAREIVRALLRAQAVNPRLHKVLIEQVPRVGRMRAMLEMNEEMALLVRGYLEEHRDEVRPHNLEIASFVVVRAVEAVAHATVTEKPEYLVDGELADELAELALSYLSARRPRKT